MSPFPSMMRRLSRSSSARKSQQQQQQQQTPQSPTTYSHQTTTTGPGPGGAALPSSATANQRLSVRDQALGDDYMVLPKTGNAQEARPISSATDQSFDFANRPVSGVSTGGIMTSHVPRTSTGASLSRTDQVVLKYFWESKYQENLKRDLHYLKFPFFPQYPGHKDLLPYCEIYHLVKTSEGATIISLGSADGVYIGFELQTGSQLHIDLDDDWFTSNSSTRITHHRVAFRPYTSMMADPDAPIIFKSWPKPLTIEFLEEQYQSWQQDLMSLCWEAQEVRELGANGTAGADSADIASTTNMPGQSGGIRNSSGHMGSHVPGPGSVDDGYVSERSTGRGI